MEIAFVGLGNMGGPMARNLVKAGQRVTGYDVLAAQRERFAAAGGFPAASLADCVRSAELVFTMLPAGEHVREAYLAPGGILANIRPGALLIDCSTIAPAMARDVAEAARRQGVPMLDAPVSGGTAGAEAHTLTFIVGGDERDLARAKPALQLMGKAIFHAGPAGAGQVVKMCNNMMLGIQMAGACEALRLGIAHGIDPAKLSEIMLGSSGRNWVLEVYNPCPGVLPSAPASRGYTGGFSSDLMLKDLGLAAEAAATTHVSTPLGALARALYSQHHDRGKGHLDFSSVFQDEPEARSLFEVLARAAAPSTN